MPQPEPASAVDTGHRRTQPRSSGDGVSTIATVAAMFIGAFLGLVVLFFVKNARNERRATLDSEPDAAVASAIAPTPKLVATPPSTARPSSTDAELDAAGLRSTDVILHLPAGARMIVNGHEMPPGSTSIPRPNAGSVTILVRADGREDAFVEVRPTSPGDMVVAMALKPRAPKSGVAQPSASGSAAAPAASITTPPNPYE